MLDKFTAKAKDLAANKTLFLEDQWANLVQIILPRLMETGAEALSNEDNLRSVLENVYEVLPLPVRLVVSRDKFSEFGLGKRNMLIEKVTSQYDLYKSRVGQEKEPSIVTGQATSSRQTE
ncbi:hypothetical protein ACI2KR_31010 [Pseudomonas luteola]